MNQTLQNACFSELEFLPTSGQDDTGRVFEYNGEIYRGINKSHSRFYRQLFSSPIKSDLEELGVIPTRIFPGLFFDFDLILSHEKVPFVSYPVEWSDAMLKKAALVVLDIQLYLIKHGMVLKDAHPFNILFSGRRPYFVDVGSIEKFTDKRFNFFLKEFINDFYLSLLVIHTGHREIFDAFMLSRLGLHGDSGNSRFLFLRLFLGAMPFGEWLSHAKSIKKINKSRRLKHAEVVKLLKRQIAKIHVSREKQETQSQRFPKYSAAQRDDRADSGTKIIEYLIKKISPKSVIIFSDEKHALTERLSSAIGYIIDASTNDDYLNSLFTQYTGSNPDNVLPVRMNLFSPTPSHGPWGLCTSGNKRLKTELSVLHNLSAEKLRTKRSTLINAVSYLSRFSTNWSIVDFKISKESSLFPKSDVNKITLSSISDALNEVYESFKAIEQPNGSGWIFLCRKSGSQFPSGLSV